MIVMDFALARFNHQIWKIKLRSFLDGKTTLSDAELVSHTACDLGQWIYAEGLTRYGALPEMRQLEKAHANLHGAVRRIVDLSRAGDLAQAKQEFAAIIDPLSKEVVSLLTAIEQQVKRS